MLIIFAGLAISQAEINPLGDCALIRQVTFYDNMSSLPPEIKADIAKRHGPILPRMARGISFSDVASSSSKPGPLLLYVAHETISGWSPIPTVEYPFEQSLFLTFRMKVGRTKHRT